MEINSASPGFGAGRSLKPVTVCGGGDGSRSDNRRLGRLTFQSCDLFLQSCDLVAKLALAVLKYYEFHFRHFMQDPTDLSQTFIRFLLLQLGHKQRDLRIKLLIGTARILQLTPDAADFSVRLLRSFLPFDGSLLSLSEGLSSGGHRPIEVGKFGFLVLEATLEVVIFSLQRSCAIVIIPQFPQFLVISLVDLAREKLYLLSGVVHLFPVILLGEKAVALLSDGSGGLFSSGLVTSGNSNLEFQFVGLRG